MVKKSGCNAGDPGSIPGSGSSPGEGNGNPLQYSCLDRVPWTEEPGRLQSMGLQRIGHDWATNTTLASQLQNPGLLNFPDPFLWSVHPRSRLSILHLIVKRSEPLGGRIEPGPWTQWCAGECLTAGSLEGEGSPTLQHCGVFFFLFVCFLLWKALPPWQVLLTRWHNWMWNWEEESTAGSRELEGACSNTPPRGSMPGPHGHLVLLPSLGRVKSKDMLHSFLPIMVSGAQESTSLSAPLLHLLLLVNKSCSKDVSTQASFSWLLITNMCVCAQSLSCVWLCSPVDCSPPGSSVHGDSLGQNSGVGCHALLQGIFPTQGSNQGLPHCRRILYHLSCQGSLLTNMQTSHCSNDWLKSAYTPVKMTTLRFFPV